MGDEGDCKEIPGIGQNNYTTTVQEFPAQQLLGNQFAAARGKSTWHLACWCIVLALHDGVDDNNTDNNADNDCLQGRFSLRHVPSQALVCGRAGLELRSTSCNAESFAVIVPNANGQRCV